MKVRIQRKNIMLPNRVFGIAILMGIAIGSSSVISSKISILVWVYFLPLFLICGNGIEVFLYQKMLPLITYTRQISFVIGSITSLPVFLFFVAYAVQFGGISTLSNANDFALALFKSISSLILIWLCSVFGAFGAVYILATMRRLARN